MVLLAIRAAFALDMECYTYGGFEQVVGAFSKMALIFSDSGFGVAIFVAMVIGILFGNVALAMRAVGGRFSTLSWGVPLMAGYLIYAAMIVPPIFRKNSRVFILSSKCTSGDERDTTAASIFIVFMYSRCISTSHGGTGNLSLSIIPQSISACL